MKKKGLIIAALVALPVAGLAVANLSSGPRTIEQPVIAGYGVADPQFQRSMAALLGPTMISGNTVTALQNGDEIFPAMLAAIRGARTSITFETYIYWSGVIGRQFTDALAERARAGVRVHVLLDAMGIGKIDDGYIATMDSAGVEVLRYHPLHWYTLARLNNRTHRKILVVDGRIGFTGGVGIADVWLGNAEDPGHWRDAHFRVTGPVVAQMQAAFMDNWVETRHGLLHDERYFPRLDASGPHLGQVFISSYDSGAESVRLMYLLSIAAARHRIQIANAYFVPDDLVRQALIDARRRGVEIDVILPGRHTDAVVTRRASRSRWGPLIEAGVRIHEYRPTMYHTKMMIVDDVWVSVGSTNFDNRSFRLNDEMNLNVYDSAFARAQSAVFAADLARSTVVTLEAWRRRPFSEKAKEWLAGLLRSQT